MAIIKNIRDTQLAKSPKDVFYCKKCVVSNQRPRITFNKDGVCSACEYAHEKHHVIDWKKREEQLHALLDKYRSKDGSYDCVVPGSGGKDSAYVSHMLKYQYNMNPLTVTWAPYVYTQIGWDNYVAWKDSGFDNVLVFPNGQIHRKLARIAFEVYGDHFLPFGYGQKALAFHMAVKYGIPLIFYGESGEVEYGGSTENKDVSAEGTENWNEIYFHGGGVDNLVEEGKKHGRFTKQELERTNFEHYRPPAIEKIKALNAQMHWFSYFKKWVPQENFYYATQHCGFKANPGRSEGTYSKYASIDDQTDGFHYWLAYIKFGICRATSDAAHEIRDSHLTREEGIALVHRYDGEFPEKHFQVFLKYLDITEAEFWEIIDYYRLSRPHLWEKRGSDWHLKHRVS